MSKRVVAEWNWWAFNRPYITIGGEPGYDEGWIGFGYGNGNSDPVFSVCFYFHGTLARPFIAWTEWRWHRETRKQTAHTERPERPSFDAVGGEHWSNVHEPSRCEGESCVVHNPSEHHMREWRMHLRETGLVERICEHGIGHPDPDSAAYFNRVTSGGWGVHGCDGCCIDVVGEAKRTVQSA